MVTHNRHPQSPDPLLAELARLYGVQLAYRDSKGRWRESPLESVVLVLRALGAELGDGGAADPLRGVTPARMAAAIAERKRELWSRVVEPVIVAWEGKLPPMTVRLPVGPSRSAASSGLRGGGLKVTLLLEEGVRAPGMCPGTLWRQWERRRSAEPVRGLPATQPQRGSEAIAIWLSPADRRGSRTGGGGDSDLGAAAVLGTWVPPGGGFHGGGDPASDHLHALPDIMVSRAGRPGDVRPPLCSAE